jgi:TPR repeat protein
MSKKPMILTAIILASIILAINFFPASVPVPKLASLTDSTYITYYKKACNLEDSEACNDLGDIYFKDKDYEDAVEFYKQSCTLENAEGCNNLAYMLDQGLGIERHNWEALKLYERSCKSGNMRACYNVGAMYFKGEGAKRNYYKASVYFKKACNADIASACNDLAYMYANGKNFKKNITKAIGLYYDACDMGEASGCNNLGYMYEMGDGVRKNLQKAERFYEKACSLDDYPSCDRLETVLGKKIREITTEEDFNAAKKACKNSTKGGTMCYKLGLYFEKNDEKDLALKYFETACDRGQSQSCKHLGDIARQ